MNKPQIIIIGGGLSGLSAAHTVLERGGNIVLIEKNPFCGGNSTKATSGINGALTRVQIKNKIQDSPDAFLKDTALSASKGLSDIPSDLNRVLVNESSSSVHWLIDKFNLDLSILSRLGGASFPRTHRGKERFPGMAITYRLLETLENIVKKSSKARILLKSKADKLLTENGEVIGLEYIDKNNQVKTEYGPVIIATGGYGADFSKEGILASVRKDLLHLPTSNGDHCTGDGIKMAKEIGAADKDLECVQVHPTGLIDPKNKHSKTLFLAAEALRGCGGLIIDRDGKRFVDELGRRDYVTEKMQNRKKDPYRLILNTAASNEISWHCNHYCGRGLMKLYQSGTDFANNNQINPDTLNETFKNYNQYAINKNDPYGKKYFKNTPFTMEGKIYASIISPLIHYCMGGIRISTDSNIVKEDGTKIPGLFASGEVIGGIHGKNRLGGSSLLDCVVFGRISGFTASKYLLNKLSSSTPTTSKSEKINLTLDPNNKSILISFKSNNTKTAKIIKNDSAQNNPKKQEEIGKKKEEKIEKKVIDKNREYSMNEVKKHNKQDDCWIVVNKRVLNVTNFLSDHPGGKKAILLYAGKDATEEFKMLHESNVIEKYAPDVIIGKVKETKMKL